MLNREVLVSVIIPVKNMEKYIEKCVNSILNQSEERIELIIVDFGSEDNTVPIIEKINDKRIILIQEELKDVAEARNIGLDKARGKYVSFIDADDWIDLNFYELIINKMQADKADIGICGFKYINEADNGISYEKYFHNISINLDEDNINDFLMKNAMGEINCEAWNKVYKKSFIDDAKIKFDNIEGINGEDLLLNYLLYMNFPTVVFEEEMLYYHLVRNKSLGKIKNIDVSNRFNYIVKKIISYSQKNNLYEIVVESIAMQYLAFIIFQLTNNNLNLFIKVKNYRKNIILKKIHKEYMRLCIKSKYSNLKRKILAITIYLKLDIIFIIFSYFMKEV